MDAYLTSFEHLARANGWPREQWAIALQGGLTGSKAISLFCALQHILNVFVSQHYYHQQSLVVQIKNRLNKYTRKMQKYYYKVHGSSQPFWYSLFAPTPIL